MDQECKGMGLKCCCKTCLGLKAAVLLLLGGGTGYALGKKCATSWCKTDAAMSAPAEAGMEKAAPAKKAAKKAAAKKAP